MSIAVQIQITASRMLWLLLCLFCSLVSGISVYVLNLSEFDLGYKIFAAITVLILIALLLYGYYARYYSNRRTVMLDISDAGRIILRLCDSKKQAYSVQVLISPQSTVSSNFMLLHLYTEHQERFIIPVLSDGVSADQFRRLSVALRSILFAGVE